MNLVIHITDGPDAGRRFPVTAKGLRIGSSTDCELSLGDRSVAPHAATLMHEQGRLTVYPVGDVQLAIAGRTVDSRGSDWQRGQFLAVGNCQLQLLEEQHLPEPAPAGTAVPTEQALPIAAGEPVNSSAPAKPKSDLPQYALIGVILLAAVGIVLLPDDVPLGSSRKASVSLPEVLQELKDVPRQPPGSQPTLAEIRDQLWAGYRSAASPELAQAHFARAMEMLMMRATDVNREDDFNANEDGSPGNLRAPVRFDTEVEYRIYDFLRGKLGESR